MKYIANKYRYEVKDLNDVADLDTIICDNEPFDTEGFDTMEESTKWVRLNMTEKSTK